MAWSKLDWSVYHQIPDDLCDRYLARLNIEKDAPSTEYLDALVRAHLYAIPFENLDTTLWHVPVSIEPRALRDKLLRQNRGGYCFELNGAFYLLLRALGFDAVMCPGRQLRHDARCAVPATHCAVLVNVEGKVRFCDVGYGGPAPRGSLELECGRAQTVENETFLFHTRETFFKTSVAGARDSGWRILARKSPRHAGRELHLMEIAPVHCHLCDFYGQNMLRSTGDSAYETVHVTRMTPEGYIDLTGDRLRIHQNGRCAERTVHAAELSQVLRQYFAICTCQ